MDLCDWNLADRSLEAIHARMKYIYVFRLVRVALLLGLLDLQIQKEKLQEQMLKDMPLCFGGCKGGLEMLSSNVLPIALYSGLLH